MAVGEGSDRDRPRDDRICHQSQEWQRLAWCNNKCSDHKRPKGLREDDFRTIDLCSKSPSTSDKVIIDKVLAVKASWMLLGGKDNRNAILGMQESSGGGAGPSTGGGGGRGHGGKGKGKGRQGDKMEAKEAKAEKATRVEQARASRILAGSTKRT